MNSILKPILIAGYILTVLPACYESKKVEKKFEFKVPKIEIKVPDLNINFKSPVPFSENPQGKFEEDPTAVVAEAPGCAKAGEYVFDTRLKVGQKFVQAWSSPVLGSVLGSITTKVIKSVSHNVIEVQVSRDLGYGPTEHTEICEFKAIGTSRIKSVQCKSTKPAESTPSRDIKPDPNAESCKIAELKSDSDVLTKGTFTFINGLKIPAVKQVKIQTGDYRCGKGQEPKVSRGPVKFTEITITGYNVLEINRVQCEGASVFFYFESKGPGVRTGNRFEELERPVVQQ